MTQPGEPEPYSWSWAAPAIGLVVATGIVALLRYPHLPAQLNVHFDAAGHPDRTVATTPWSVATPVLLQAGITAVLLGVVTLQPHGRHQHPLPSAVKKAILILAASVDVSLLAAAWQTWSDTDSISLWPVIVPPVLALVGCS